MSNQLQVSGEAKIRAIQGPVVANSGVITALDGDASEYVRGDGTLADFPTSTGGGSSVSYYLNTSVSQGTIGGVAYKQLSKTPISGAGTDVTISANGYIASYITDANDPALLEVPAGNFNCEFYFSVNSNSHNPYVYAELYKYDGTTFTLLGSNVAIPQYLTNGTTLSAYYFAIPVATSVLTVTDRIAIRIYVNVDGRTVTLHTENNHLCQVVTTFSKGLISLNNLTRQNQFFATGTSGTDFNISSATATHTFNIPDASATNRGLITTGTQTIAGAKTFSGGVTANSYYAQGNGTQGGYLYLKQGIVPYSTLTGSNSISADGTKYIFFSDAGSSNGKIALFELGSLTNNTNRTYTLPDATGTLALTSDLSSYVPYTGATGSVNLGSYALTASALNVTNTSTFNGNIILKKVGLSVSSPLYVTQFAATTGVGIGYSDGTGGANFILQTAAIYDYTFPAATGTLALLEGTQTFTGVKTFSAATKQDSGVLLKNGTMSALAGYTGIGGGSLNNGIDIILNGGAFTQSLLFQTAAGYSYTFPAATGTIALTSNLSSYVPYTGATSGVDLGIYNLSSNALIVNGTVAAGGSLNLKQNATTVATGIGYNSIGAKTANSLQIYYGGATSLDNKTILFNVTNLTNTSTRTFEFPDASGTIALTSGTQTFTGATTFSSNITVNSVQVGSAGNTTNIKLGDSTFGAITTGSNNIAIGTSALTSITTSNANIGIGNSALASVVDGAFNTAIGFGIGGSITSGSNNALFGYGAGSSITTGNYNTIIGAYAGTAAMANNIVLADGAGTIRYQWNGTNNAFTGAATFSSSVNVQNFLTVSSTSTLLAPSSGKSIEMVYRTDGSNDYAFIQAYDRTAGAYKRLDLNSAITILPTGNVGIGTSSPNANLEVAAPNTLGSFARFRLNSQYYANWDLLNNSDLAFIRGSSEYMRITSGGDLTLGNLSVVGARKINLQNASNGYAFGINTGCTQFEFFNGGLALIATINGATGVYTPLSDVNKKKDFEASTIGLKEVLQLKPTLYRFKDGEDDAEKDLGFIAQEVKEFIPQAYVESGDEDNKFIGLNYNPIVAVLVKAIQEQNQMITSLQNRLDKAGL